ncbi:YggT family protein [soil metagenome]|jgi:YggT family protein|nr:YggT family protein [Chloroflexota bacterium]MBA3959137.1 YggT family protein [Chloroflexota bacterium]
MPEFLAVFFRFFVIALWLVVLGRVLVSWVDPQFGNPVSRFLFETTEPLLAPVRKVMPQTGMFDFAPLVLLLVLGVLMRVV